MRSSGHYSATESLPSASENQANSVYKYYDPFKILIYVGITKTGITRNRQHNADKAWWPFVAEQAVEHFATRAEAHAREVELITKFRPPFNVQHNPDHVELREAYIALHASGELGLSARQLVATGRKSTIALYVLSTESDEEYDWVTLVPRFMDMRLAGHIKGAGKRPVTDARGRRIGTVKQVIHEEHVTKIRARVSRVAMRQTGQANRIYAGGSAQLRYTEQKPSVVAEIAFVALRVR